MISNRPIWVRIDAVHAFYRRCAGFGCAGVSSAAPAVSGALALLRRARPDLTPAGLIAILRFTGKPITDSRNGVTTLRIDTLAASEVAVFMPHQDSRLIATTFDFCDRASR